MTWKHLIIHLRILSPECVEMKINTRIRVISVLMLIIPFAIVLAVPYGNGENINDPLIDTDLELHMISSMDTSPAVMRLIIPWDGGEPAISNISFRISDGDWIQLNDWEEFRGEGDDRSTITFPIDLDWGARETVFVNVSDRMGSDSIVGCPVVLSRPPSVDLVTPLGLQDDLTPGEYIFEVSAMDPDGQVVSCLWKVDNETITQGSHLTAYLDEGFHSIRVEVSDGQWTIVKEAEMKIEESDTEGSGSGIDLLRVLSITFLVIVIISVLLFLSFAFYSYYRSRWKEEMDADSDAEMDYDQSSAVCDICLNELKKGRSVKDCRCGASFHAGCGRREGVCPECGREILI